MPSRIIRDGWLESEMINTLDAPAERFFLRLCLRADDYGRYHGNVVLLKSNLFPLREDVRNTDIPRWLAACEKAGLLRCYEADAKPFLQIAKFDQRTRSPSKFPAPPSNDSQMTVKCQSSASTSPPYSEANAYSNAEAKAPPASAAEVVLPKALDTPEFRDAWTKWKLHRSEIRHPLKPTSEQVALGELERMGVTRAARAIRWTIFKGWRGLREPEPADAKQFDFAAPTQQSIREPANWKSFLNHEFPDSRFSSGQKDEAHEWQNLDEQTQRWLVGEMRKKGEL